MSNHVVAAILDVDGTLVESNDAHAWAWFEALRESGYQRNYSDIRSLIGAGGDKLTWALVNRAKGDPEAELLIARQRALFRERYLPRVQPVARARELVQRMRDDGMQLGIASSAPKQDVLTLLELARVKDLIDQVVSASDVWHTKPESQSVTMALEKLGARPTQAIMIGDTPYDVEAARRAGVETIVFRCGGWSDEDLGGAIAIYNHPADLLAHYEESPLSHTPSIAA